MWYALYLYSHKLNQFSKIDTFVFSNSGSWHEKDHRSFPLGQHCSWRDLSHETCGSWTPGDHFHPKFDLYVNSPKRKHWGARRILQYINKDRCTCTCTIIIDFLYYAILRSLIFGSTPTSYVFPPGCILKIWLSTYSGSFFHQVFQGSPASCCQWCVLSGWNWQHLNQ